MINLFVIHNTLSSFLSNNIEILFRTNHGIIDQRARCGILHIFESTILIDSILISYKLQFIIVKSNTLFPLSPDGNE